MLYLDRFTMKKRTLFASSLILFTSFGVPSFSAERNSAGTAVSNNPTIPKPSNIPGSTIRIPTPARPPESPDPTKPGSAPTPSTDSKPASLKPTPAKAGIELLNAGAPQGRQSLRFKPVINAKDLLTMTMNMDMNMQFSGTQIPSKLPPIVMKVETTVTKVEPNGDIHYTFRYVDSNVATGGSLPPQVLESVRSQIKKINGLSGTVVSDDRGQFKSATFQAPKTLDASTKQVLDQLSQSMKTLSAQLPAEPVGVGAKWRVIQPMNTGGIKLNQTATYELVNIANGVVTMKGTVAQDANSQRLSQPGLPNNVVMNLKSMTSTGQWNTTFRLDRLMPMKADVSLTSQSDMEVSSSAKGATPTPIRADIVTQVTMEGQAR
jgi:hypothetical protein